MIESKEIVLDNLANAISLFDKLFDTLSNTNHPSLEKPQPIYILAQIYGGYLASKVSKNRFSDNTFFYQENELYFLQ